MIAAGFQPMGQAPVSCWLLLRIHQLAVVGSPVEQGGCGKSIAKWMLWVDALLAPKATARLPAKNAATIIAAVDSATRCQAGQLNNGIARKLWAMNPSYRVVWLAGGNRAGVALEYKASICRSRARTQVTRVSGLLHVATAVS